MANYHFNTTLECLLVDGTTQIVRDFEVVTEGAFEQQARGLVKAEATWRIDEAGDRYIDAPLDRLEVTSCTLIEKTDFEAVTESDFEPLDDVRLVQFLQGR